MSDEKKSEMEKLINTLKQHRDELALQIHLGEMEAKEEFDKAKDKLDQMTAQFDPLKHAVSESADNVFASLQLVGEEIKKSFERVRKSL